MQQLSQNVPGRESRAIESFLRVPLQSPCPIQNQHRRAGFKRFLTRGVARSRSLTPWCKVLVVRRYLCAAVNGCIQIYGTNAGQGYFHREIDYLTVSETI